MKGTLPDRKYLKKTRSQCFQRLPEICSGFRSEIGQIFQLFMTIKLYGKSGCEKAESTQQVSYLRQTANFAHSPVTNHSRDQTEDSPNAKSE